MQVVGEDLHEDNWDINETYSRSGEMEHFATLNSGHKNLFLFAIELKGYHSTIGYRKYIERSPSFLQNNRVEADENLSWKQNKFRIPYI
ncbi:hypothetical protein AVEN_233466-1 [Araneus ventricosus]|uniref:Uncharacterized protein n=1 Tax=Araneus ventricosus TaxID=182803 RepID=A0A4Y2TW99_ARAVE|nr:hypothetical protein AVEN_233466-1 [Araneus ventricosus]